MTLQIADADIRSPALTVRLLGSFELEVGGNAVSGLSRPARSLLAFLVLHSSDRAIERDFIAATLWPDSDDGAARYNLRRALSELRTAFGPEAARLTAPTPRTLHLGLGGDVDCDMAALDAALAKGAGESGDDALQIILDRYASRGALLAGDRAEWIIPERELRVQSYRDAREALAQRLRARGRMADAVRQLRAVLAQDPTRETAVRALMTALHDSGQNAAAIAAYRILSDRLQSEEGGGVPDAETTALHERLCAGSERRGAIENDSGTLAPPAMPRGLPRPLSTLIGRDRDRLEVAAHFRGDKGQPPARLLTLIGAGGVGKTQLSLVVAESIRADFADGACFVDLAPIGDPEELPSLIAGALQLPDSVRGADFRLLDQIADTLQPRELLLVLDNCEHLAGDASRIALALLRQCPRLAILATSRQALRVPGEIAWRVPGLNEDAAARLFVERAGQANPALRPNVNDAAIRQIAGRLDGIPLAIEMAAARVRVLSIAQIAARLDDVFRLLAVPGGDLLPRHQTLRATFDWSYNLLTPAERILLARLSIFAGGWTLDAAEAVGSDDTVTADDILDLMSSLVEKSLIAFVIDDDGGGRYRMLETVRQYGREKLAASGEEVDVCRRHQAFFVAFVQGADLSGSGQALWLRKLEVESDNLRAVFAGCGADEDQAEVRLVLATALWRFWDIRGYYNEGREILARALERGAAAPAAIRATALVASGVLAHMQGDLSAAWRLLQAGLALRRTLGDVRSIAIALKTCADTAISLGDNTGARSMLEESLTLSRTLDDNQATSVFVLNSLAMLVFSEGDYALARSLFEESLASLRRSGNTLGIAIVLNNLASVVSDQEDYVAAKAMNDESLAIRREVGDRPGVAMSQTNLGLIASYMSEFEAAREAFEEALAIYRDVSDRKGAANVLNSIGLLYVERCEYDAASRVLEESLTIYQELGDRRGCADGLNAQAALAPGQSDAERAVTLDAASEALYGLLGTRLSPRSLATRTARREKARSLMGEARFEAALHAGRALTWEEAVKLALGR